MNIYESMKFTSFAKPTTTTAAERRSARHSEDAGSIYSLPSSDLQLFAASPFHVDAAAALRANPHVAHLWGIPDNPYGCTIHTSEMEAKKYSLERQITCPNSQDLSRFGPPHVTKPDFAPTSPSLTDNNATSSSGSQDSLHQIRPHSFFLQTKQTVGPARHVRPVGFSDHMAS
ncbi:hypothetical protein T440DRAFT_476372 [Plenodomus tracheiphilus IPT5]|uniref:Uncharacterized protein n=1 Tax=Plenodomus tracheiphilus IPT5 TaxID=1408161 RepID=A0A6A7BE82_9PLEO|nr:hypothetical protein T440DRAFT_476372 [Plenodomus tracheiphilus IPT5]